VTVPCSEFLAGGDLLTQQPMPPYWTPYLFDSCHSSNHCKSPLTFRHLFQQLVASPVPGSAVDYWPPFSDEVWPSRSSSRQRCIWPQVCRTAIWTRKLFGPANHSDDRRCKYRTRYYIFTVINISLDISCNVQRYGAEANFTISCFWSSSFTKERNIVTSFDSVMRICSLIWVISVHYGWFDEANDENSWTIPSPPIIHNIVWLHV